MNNYIKSLITDEHFNKGENYEIVSFVSTGMINVLDKNNEGVVLDVEDKDFIIHSEERPTAVIWSNNKDNEQNEPIVVKHRFEILTKCE